MEYTIVDTFYENHYSIDFKVTIALGNLSNNEEQQWSLSGYMDTYFNDGSHDSDHADPIEIIQYFPHLSIFKILNERDILGVPLRPIEYGLQLIEEGELDELAEYYLLQDCEKSFFKNVTTPEYLSYLIKKLGIDNRWKKYSQEGIEQLEKISGFRVPDYMLNETSIRFNMSAEEYKKIDSIVKNAYPDTRKAEKWIIKAKEQEAQESDSKLDEIPVSVKVDNEGKENIFSVMIVDNTSFFTSIELPKGSIKKLIGRELTHEDGAVELK